MPSPLAAALSVAADDAVTVDDIADADDSPYTINATHVVDVLLFVQYFHHCLYTTKMSQRILSLRKKSLSISKRIIHMHLTAVLGLSLL